MGTRKKFYLSFFSVFVAGLLVGAVFTNGFIKRQIALEMRDGPEVARKHLIEMMAHELDLNREQVQAIKPIIAAADKKLILIKSRSLPEVEQIFDENINKAKTVLNQQQQEKVLTVYSQMKERWHQLSRAVNESNEEAL